MKSKNEVDANSINDQLWGRLLNMFERIIGTNGFLNEEKYQTIDYIAYESNHNLLPHLKEKVEKLGLKVTQDQVFSGIAADGKTNINLFIKTNNFEEDAIDEHVDLVLGCCFADLYHPDTLVSSILHILKNQHSSSAITIIFLPNSYNLCRNL